MKKSDLYSCRKHVKGETANETVNSDYYFYDQEESLNRFSARKCFSKKSSTEEDALGDEELARSWNLDEKVNDEANKCGHSFVKFASAKGKHFKFDTRFGSSSYAQFSFVQLRF